MLSILKRSVVLKKGEWFRFKVVSSPPRERNCYGRAVSVTVLTLRSSRHHTCHVESHRRLFEKCFTCPNLCSSFMFVDTWSALRSRDSSVGITTMLWAERQGLDFRALCSDPGNHPACYPWVPGSVSPDSNGPGSDSDHSPYLSSAAIINTWRYTFTPPYVIIIN